jgi:F0F1-type ATP synthase assembly protein I
VSRLEIALDFVGGVLVLAGLGAVLILALAL